MNYHLQAQHFCSVTNFLKVIWMNHYNSSTLCVNHNVRHLLNTVYIQSTKRDPCPEGISVLLSSVNSALLPLHRPQIRGSCATSKEIATQTHFQTCLIKVQHNKTQERQQTSIINNNHNASLLLFFHQFSQLLVLSVVKQLPLQAPQGKNKNCFTPHFL